MFATRKQIITTLAVLATAAGFSSTAQAQLFGSRNYYFYGVQPVYPAYPTTTYLPTVQTAAVSDCPCMKTVQKPVYKDVEVVEYKPVQKTAQVPVIKTVLEDREVTTYETINEVKTVEVPTYVNQTVTQMQQVTQNNSYWRTNWQPVPKMNPCLYDGRPGIVGELNRLGYAFRNSVTPNAVARREYVPNVVTYNVPVQQTVQVPTTRTVSYNVSRQVPVTTVRKVPVQKTVYEDRTYTAYEPYTTKKTVQIGTRYETVYTDSGSSQTASSDSTNSGTQSAGKGTLQRNSMPSNTDVPIRTPVYRNDAEQTPTEAEPEPTPARNPVAKQPKADAVIKVAGWQATRSVAKPATSKPLIVPSLVAQQ